MKTDIAPFASFLAAAPEEGGLRRKTAKTIKHLQRAIKEMPDCINEFKRVRQFLGGELMDDIGVFIANADHVLAQTMNNDFTDEEGPRQRKKAYIDARLGVQLALEDFQHSFKAYLSAVKDISETRETSREIAAKAAKKGHEEITTEMVFEYFRQEALKGED